jgi:hypothetical protein
MGLPVLVAQTLLSRGAEQANCEQRTMDSEEVDRPTGTLRLEPDEMRRLGYWVVDSVIDYIERGPNRPVITTGFQPSCFRYWVGRAVSDFTSPDSSRVI